MLVKNRRWTAHRGWSWLAAVAVVAVLLTVFAAPMSAAGNTTLTGATVTPRTGTPTTQVVITVTYQNATDSRADQVTALVGTEDFTMTRQGGDDWDHGVTFRWSGVVKLGTHAVFLTARAHDGSVATIKAGTIKITATATPTPAPTPTPTPKPTAKPTPTPTPTAKPTATPTPRPTATPTAKPPAKPSAKPVAKPTPRPATRATARPTSRPVTIKPTVTIAATPEPSPTAEALPTDVASPEPSPEPSTPPLTAAAVGGAATGGTGPGGSGGSGGSGVPTDPGGGGAGKTKAWGPVASILAIVGLSGPTLPELSLAPTLVTTTGAVATAMAFGLFGRRRRDDDVPDEVLAAAAASGVGVHPSHLVGAGAAAAVAVPVASHGADDNARPAEDGPPAEAIAPQDDELLLPRWRRPSLIQARKADPVRDMAPGARLTFGEGLVGPLAGRERRMIRYRVVRLLDSPDELRGAEIGYLDQGDEVQLIEKYGAYWLVISPDGQQGWLHKMVLGEIVDADGAPPPDVPVATMPTVADSWTMGESDVDSDVFDAYLEARRRAG